MCRGARALVGSVINYILGVFIANLKVIAASFVNAKNESHRPLCLFRPSALALFPHGLNLAEVFRATLGGCLTTTATEGNGGGIFLCHAARVQKAVAVCKRELCINSI